MQLWVGRVGEAYQKSVDLSTGISLLLQAFETVSEKYIVGSNRSEKYAEFKKQ